LRNLPGIAAASRWSVMFHEILHNVEELPQWSRGALPYSMFSAHQHPGPLAHYRIHPSFSSRIFALFVFSYFLFPCSQDFLSIPFSRIFSTILLRCTIVFLFRQMPRLLFYEYWVQYERSLANSSNLCTDPIWLHSYCCGLPNGQPLCLEHGV